MKGQGVRRARLHVNHLESRLNPTVSVSLLNGVLNVIGDTAANNLSVNLSGGNLFVSTGQSFAASAVSCISIDGAAGVDTISVGGVSQQCWIFGGAGNDVITASGFNNDLIYGGNGTDSLNSGAGNDTIYGNAGTDGISDTQGINSVNQESPYQAASLDVVSNSIV